jgi:hypothetical protein
MLLRAVLNRDHLICGGRARQTRLTRAVPDLVIVLLWPIRHVRRRTGSELCGFVSRVPRPRFSSSGH